MFLIRELQVNNLSLRKETGNKRSLRIAVRMRGGGGHGVVGVGGALMFKYLTLMLILKYV